MERPITACVLVQGTITDEEKYRVYREAVMPPIGTFGGQHVRGGTVELLKGGQDQHWMGP